MESNVVKLYATETATLSQLSPNSSFYNSNPTTLTFNGMDSYDSDVLLVKFGDVPEDKKRYRCKSGNLRLYVYSYESNNSPEFKLTVSVLPSDYSLQGRTYAKDNDGLSSNYVAYATPTSIGFLDIPVTSGAPNASAIAKNGTYIRIFSPLDNPGGISSVVSIASGDKDENRPFFLGELESPTISTKLSPRSGFIDEKKPVTLSWTWGTDALGGPSVFQPENEVIEWRNGDNGEIETITISESATSYIIPENTFPETDNLQIRVKVTYDGGISSESEWVSLTTIDKKPAVDNLYPKSIYLDGSIENKFKWDYVVDTGSSQYGATLEYSSDNGLMWETLGSVSGGNTYYSVPANTLPAGSILWRVKATNSDGIDSEWSESAAIVVRSAPMPPIISVTEISPRPLIEWQSEGQQAYQVVVGKYDSGELYGTIKKYKIPEFLPNGKTEIKVRVQNEFGIWSDWASDEITIENKSLGNVFLNASAKTHNIRLTWVADVSAGYPVYYIYRDEILIGKTNETSYIDELAFGIHKYQVRCAINDFYTMSNMVSERLIIKTACIAEYGLWDWIDLPLKRGSMPTLSTIYGCNVVYQHFAGRELPVAEIGDDLDVVWSFSFSALSKDTCKKMSKFFGKIVVYKDPRDGVCVGVLGGQQMVSDRYGWDLTYTIQAVDYKEVIEYDLS